MKLKRLNKRGFSLVEVAIAMAVVSIVTFAALSIIYPATDKTVEANARSNAIYFAADVIECLKATETPEELQAALDQRDGVTKVKFEIENDPNATTVVDAEYKINGSNLRAYVKVTVEYSGPAGFGSTRNYKVSVEIKDNDKVIFDTAYTKALR